MTTQNENHNGSSGPSPSAPHTNSHNDSARSFQIWRQCGFRRMGSGMRFTGQATVVSPLASVGLRLLRNMHRQQPVSRRDPTPTALQAALAMVLLSMRAVGAPGITDDSAAAAGVTTVLCSGIPSGSSPQMPEDRAEPARPIAWGPVVNGMQTGLRLEASRTTFAPGEIIWQDVYLRNRTREELIVTASGGYEEQGAPIIVRANGSKVKILRYFGMGAMFVVNKSVKPGEIGIVGRFAVTFREPQKGADQPHEVAPGISFSAEGTALALAGPGAYRLQQEITPLSADGRTARRPLRTASIPIRIAGELTSSVPAFHKQIPDLATAPIAWGEAKSGLQAGLMTLDMRSSYYVGERVRLAVVLRNISNRPISFWHETSFAFLEPPNIVDEGGKDQSVKLASEPEWRALGEIKMTGVTFDMTFAPSADGPSRLRQSELKPGHSSIGYWLSAFVVSRRFPSGSAGSGRFRVVQPVRLGLGEAEKLDSTLTTGTLPLDFLDPDAPASHR